MFEWDACSMYVSDVADLFIETDVMHRLVAADGANQRMAALYHGGLVIHDENGLPLHLERFRVPAGDVVWSERGELLAVSVIADHGTLVRVYRPGLEVVWETNREEFSSRNPIAWQPGGTRLAYLDETYRSIAIVEVDDDHAP